jgi:hypothetical protein
MEQQWVFGGGLEKEECFFRDNIRFDDTVLHKTECRKA